MLTAALALGGIGLLAALGLGIAAKVFYVHVDPLILRVEEALPGANCGGCGYAGCSSAAVAMVGKKLAPNGCVGGGPEVAVEVAEILGMAITETEPQKAKVGCRYSLESADLKFTYQGVDSCRAAVIISGGPKECHLGCIGLGSCIRSCPFGALSMGEDGLPVIDNNICTGCGSCVRTCPVGIMQLTSNSDRILGEYQYDQCTAPCQRTCPAGIDIPEQIKLTASGNYDGALLKIKERNPLPLVCGRICPRPCELECRRNLSDQPVAINYLKRFVADQERLSGKHILPYRAPQTNRKAAIIGGGVEGMTAGYYLARLGHSPTIFEASPKLGGLLRTVIPENRLPRDVLDYEIEGILKMGVEAQTDREFGRDFNLTDLFKEGFESVLIATGGWDSLLIRDPLAAPAPAMPRVYLLLPVTLAWANGRDIDLGNDVVFIGGGLAAVESAKRAKDKGAKKVTVLLRKGIDDTETDSAKLYNTKSDSIDIQFVERIDKLNGLDNELTEIEYTTENGKSAYLSVDTVIAAAGRLPDMLIVPKKNVKKADVSGMEPEPIWPPKGPVGWSTVLPYINPSIPHRGLFDGVEPSRDYLSCVEAIGAGRRAAASIHLFLSGDEVLPPTRMLKPDTHLIDVNHLENLFPVAKRQKMTESSSDQRLDPKREIELGYDPASAKKEAERCLNCGLICYKRTKYGDKPSTGETQYFTLQSSLKRAS